MCTILVLLNHSEGITMTITKQKPVLTKDEIFGSKYLWTPRINGMPCGESMTGDQVSELYKNENIINTGYELVFEKSSLPRKNYSLNFTLNNIANGDKCPVLLSLYSLRPYLVEAKDAALCVVAHQTLEQAQKMVGIDEIAELMTGEDQPLKVRHVTEKESLMDFDGKTLWQHAAEIEQPQRIWDFE